MDRKLDLEKYLAKYQSDEYRRKPTPFDSTNRQQRPINQGTNFKSTARAYEEPLDFQGTRHIRQTIQPDFHNSQTECMNLIQQIRRRLSQQQSSMSVFMDTYARQLEETLMREHIRIKDEFLDRLEKTFEENERKVREMARAHGNTEPPEFTNIRKRIAQVNNDLDRLEHELRSDNYKPAIAKIVTSDFHQQTKDIQDILTNVQKNMVEGGVKLMIDQTRYNRIGEDVTHLINIEDPFHRKAHHVHSNYLQPAQMGGFQSGNTQPRPLSPVESVPISSVNNRDRLSRTKLFSQRPPDDKMQGGSFFNFNS